MIIKQLNLDHFGKFHGREIDLNPGVNIIYGANESGKSTVHAFIQSMLFGAERLRGRGAGRGPEPLQCIRRPPAKARGTMFPCRL